jgi:hypothetical protein
MKKCSESLAIKEMQIIITLKFHLTPVRMATIKNTNKTNSGKDVGKTVPIYIAGGNVNWYNHYVKQYGGSSKN